MIVLRPLTTDAVEELHLQQQAQAAAARSRARSALEQCRQGRHLITVARWTCVASLFLGGYATIAITPWSVLGVAIGAYSLGLTVYGASMLDLTEAQAKGVLAMDVRMGRVS